MADESTAPADAGSLNTVANGAPDAPPAIESSLGQVSTHRPDKPYASGAPPDQHTKALEFFKDWSNYLLVTTTAALG